MAIFYTDSGSFNILEVTGSTILSGSLIVSGATNFGPSGLTGSLFGTSSVANTASFVEYTDVANKPALISASVFTSPSQGTVRATINGVQTDIDTGLQTTDSPSFVALTVDNDGLVVDANTDRVGVGTSVPSARLTVNGDTHISGTFTTTGGVHFLGQNIQGTSEVGLRLGFGRPQNGFAYIDLVGDATHTDYGLRIIRDNSGPNSPSKFLHRGTGNIEYFSLDPADIVWITDNATRMTVKGLGGFVGLNKTDPTARLDILGDQIISGSLIISASQAITASNVQLNSLTDTTSTNKVLVLDTATNKIFTTASVGTGGGPGGNAFPFNGAAVITGSLVVSGSSNVLRVLGSGSTVFAVSGSSGPLFEVIDSASGELFTISSASIDIFKIDNQKNVLVSGSLKVNNTLHVTGSTILSSSGTSLQVTGSSNFRDNLTVNGGTLFVDAANNRINMSGSAEITGSLRILSGAIILSASTDIAGTNGIRFIPPSGTSGYLDIYQDSFFNIIDSIARIIYVRVNSSGLFFNGEEWSPENSKDNFVSLGATGRRYKNLTVGNIFSSGSILHTGSLNVVGQVSASAGITGSLAQFNPVSLKITVGTTAPTSPAVNDLWVDTN